MATTTTNLGLTKPATTDAADVGVFNSNMDIIDAKAALKTELPSLAVTSVSNDVSGLGSVTVTLQKYGRICVADVSITTKSAYAIGSYEIIPAASVPEAYRPRIQSAGAISRQDSGMQGTGSLWINAGGKVSYGCNTAGVSGVILRGTLVYITAS